MLADTEKAASAFWRELHRQREQAGEMGGPGYVDEDLGLIEGAFDAHAIVKAVLDTADDERCLPEQR